MIKQGVVFVEAAEVAVVVKVMVVINVAFTFFLHNNIAKKLLGAGHSIQTKDTPDMGVCVNNVVQGQHAHKGTI